MTEPTDDLQQRCAEVMEWRRTGVLSGDALRNYAAAHRAGRHYSLQMAEHDTSSQAMDAVAKWGTPAPIEPPEFCHFCGVACEAPDSARRTPAPVGVEPVAEVESAVRGAGGFHARLVAGAAMPSVGTKLYTTPQPTQAQAGAVPLTDEELYDEKRSAIPQLFDLAQQWADNKIHSYQFANEAEKIVNAVARRVEAAHGIGIKGDQHGTE